MEPELEGFPDIPKDFVGKVSMMREQVGKLLEILNETVAKIPAGMSTPESELLKGITHDLGVIAPEAFEAFMDVQEAHMGVMKMGEEFADSLPGKIAEIDARKALELAPYAAANFLPKAQEPVPLFKDLLDFGRYKYYLTLTAKTLTDSMRPAEGALPSMRQRVSGTIWEKWESLPGDVRESWGSLPVFQSDYIFDLKVLTRLGLVVTQAPALPKPMNNIWENW